MNGQLKQLFRQQAAITHLLEATLCINRCIQLIKPTIKCKTVSQTAIYFNSRQIILFLTQGFIIKLSKLSPPDIQHDYNVRCVAVVNTKALQWRNCGVWIGNVKF